MRGRIITLIFCTTLSALIMGLGAASADWMEINKTIDSKQRLRQLPRLDCGSRKTTIKNILRVSVEVHLSQI